MKKRFARNQRAVSLVERVGRLRFSPDLSTIVLNYPYAPYDASSALAVDANGTVYAALDGFASNAGRIIALSPAGTLLDSYDEPGVPRLIAPSIGADGAVHTGATNRLLIFPF